MVIIKKLGIASLLMFLSIFLSGCLFLIDDFVEETDNVIEIFRNDVKDILSPESEEETVDNDVMNYEEKSEFIILPYYKDTEMCYTSEEYHEDDNICTIPVTCESAIDCEAWGDQLIHEIVYQYGSFDEFYGFYDYEYYYDEDDESLTEEDIRSYAEEENRSFLGDFDEKIVARYELKDFELVGNNGLPVNEHHEWFWHEFSWIIPSKYLGMLDSFTLFKDEELVAYVIQEEDDLRRWNLGYNLNTNISYHDSISTHIHEFAHLLFLNDDQVNAYGSQLLCRTDVYIEDKGCPHYDAYILEFIEQFGLDYEDEYDDQIFVSDYASTNILEDMAETFYMFVLTEKPAGESIAEQKILMFYDYPELVYMRAEILSRVATYMHRVMR